MQTGELMSVREYLSTSFRPDCDYVDGEVVERNVGERDHSRLQAAIIAYFYARRKEWGIEVFPEQRVQVSATRFRVPDVCVILAGSAPGQIFTTPPFICIEILSREDRINGMQERIKDYLAFGVPHVWILNPQTRSAWRCTAEGMFETQELRTENPEIVLPLAPLFE
ncbi:MAG: Uma2 family endonuclease [Candidatus Sulfopaludibacter sp.]|nr:Uma2 family endonuclease [Candidatus Sulfopaludibacter sp.]